MCGENINENIQRLHSILKVSDGSILHLTAWFLNLVHCMMFLKPRTLRTALSVRLKSEGAFSLFHQMMGIDPVLETRYFLEY
jgi:hypothetical protein